MYILSIERTKNEKTEKPKMIDIDKKRNLSNEEKVEALNKFLEDYTKDYIPGDYIRIIAEQTIQTLNSLGRTYNND